MDGAGGPGDEATFALLAAHAGKTVRQHPAGQELAELSRDEPRQARTVSPVGGGAQEVIHVFPDDLVEHTRLRVAGLIAFACTAHGPA